LNVLFGVYLCWLALQDWREKQISVWKLLCAFVVLFVWRIGTDALQGGFWLLRDMFPGMVALAVSWITKQKLGYGDGIVLLLLGLCLGIYGCAVVTAAGLCLVIFYGAVQLACCGEKDARIAWIPFLTMSFWGYLWIAVKGG